MIIREIRVKTGAQVELCKMWKFCCVHFAFVYFDLNVQVLCAIFMYIVDIYWHVFTFVYLVRQVIV